MAMLTGIAYIVMLVSKLMPSVMFLDFDFKDVVICIGGFTFGPVAAAAVSIVVAFVEMVTISATGPIGLIMNILSSCCFACVAAFLYKRNHTLKGAITGLVVGCLSATAVMLLWNFLITPIYMGVPRETVAAMLVPVFLPFNLVKGGLNMALILLLYKPVKNFMAKREAYYKDMDKAAAEKLAAAENEQQKYSGLIGKAQDEAAELKKKAMADADAAAKAHLDEAEQEKQRILADAKRAALAEKNKVLQEANAQIEEMVSAAVDKLLVPAGSAYDSFDSAESDDSGKE